MSLRLRRQSALREENASLAKGGGRCLGRCRGMGKRGPDHGPGWLPIVQSRESLLYADPNQECGRAHDHFLQVLQVRVSVEGELNWCRHYCIFIINSLNSTYQLHFTQALLTL